MSGGSFEYACYDVLDSDWALRILPKLEDMRRRSSQHPEVIPHIESVINLIYQFKNDYDKIAHPLYDLFKAIEWYHSSDWGIQSIYDELDKLSPPKDPVQAYLLQSCDE